MLSSMPFKFNADGSLDILVQAISPGPDQDSNWLPTPPSGRFNLTTRIYQPANAIFDGTYNLPAVTKVQSSNTASALHNRVNLIVSAMSLG
jgi:hypothetical protein